MRIAIYSRKSVETDSGESIKNQITLCKEYFKRNYQECVFEVFEDEGFSGSNINRPSFKRMMELVKIKQFDIVAVYKIDRIARNIVDFVNVYDELDKINVKLVSITEGFDPTTPAGKMMMLLLASFAEMERMNIAQRVKDNMNELAKMGHWSGGTPPTGYTTEKVMENNKKVTYLKLNEKSEDVKIIFEKYAKGHSTYQISNYFKSKGLNYPNKTIQNIINNPTYLISSSDSVKYLENKGYTVYGEPNGCGFLPYNRRSRIKGKKQTLAESRFVGISKHKAIIDLELWIKVQELLEEKTVEWHPRVSEFSWLAGLVKCKCGSSMFIQPGRRKKNGERIYYFRCTDKKNKKNNCKNKYLRVDFAQKNIYNTLKFLASKEKLSRVVDKNKQDKNIEKEIKKISKKISINDKAISNLVDKLTMLSNDSAKVITKRIDEFSLENNALKEDLLKLERQKLLQSLDKTNIDFLHSQILKFLDSSDDDIETRKILVKGIIKEAIWDSDSKELRVKLLE